MAEIPQNIKFLLFGFGPKMHAQMALIANLLGIVTTVLGIISAATKNPLCLGTTSWFLLTIIFFIWGLSFWFAAYFGTKEGYTK
ncbi:MAG: hypothetical protein JSV77_04495 [Dehalococcoidales bacterium]|nr:MAG: hypothetical protein JSV77_04495 [Dehalococcoidales bacterium]